MGEHTPECAHTCPAVAAGEKCRVLHPACDVNMRSLVTTRLTAPAGATRRASACYPVVNR